MAPSPYPADASEPTGRSVRAIVASVSAALVLVVVVGVWLNRGGERATPAASTGGATPSIQTEGSSTEPSPSPTKAETIGSPTIVGLGKQSLPGNGIPFTISVPSSGWYRYGDLYISKSTIGPKSAEAIILWTDVWRSNGAHACGQWWGSPVGSLASWAWHASRARGTELVRGPVDATIGGYAAQHVVFKVRKDVACKPGFFHRWKAVEAGPFWDSTEVGDTVRIWLVKVGGRVLYIESDTHEDAPLYLKQEVEQIVASMVFE